jgi:hypothetical protein
LSSDPARERDRQQQTDSKAMYFQLWINMHCT